MDENGWKEIREVVKRVIQKVWLLTTQLFMICADIKPANIVVYEHSNKLNVRLIDLDGDNCTLMNRRSYDYRLVHNKRKKHAYSAFMVCMLLMANHCQYSFDINLFLPYMQKCYLKKSIIVPHSKWNTVKEKGQFIGNIPAEPKYVRLDIEDIFRVWDDFFSTLSEMYFGITFRTLFRRAFMPYPKQDDNVPLQYKRYMVVPIDWSMIESWFSI